MNSQQIKEALAADPYTTDTGLIPAVESDSELLQYWQELKAFNEEIIAASKVEIPAGLEAKLLQIGTQEAEAEAEIDAMEAAQAANDASNTDPEHGSTVVALNSGKTNAAEDKPKQKRANFLHIAMAASIAFAVGISLNVFNQQPDIQSGSDLAMAHMYHELDYLENASRNVSLEEVNGKLAAFGGEIIQNVGQVKFANFCYFENQKSLHLVLHTDQGDITLFVTPKDLDNKIDNRFGDERFEGRSWKAQEADITIIGEKGKLNAELENTIKRSMQFSA